MSVTTNQSQPPVPPPSGTDPVLLLVLGIVVVMVLGATLYLCMAHPSLAGPIGAVGGIASALATAFGLAIALRRR
ncbi:hypothetical protein ABZ891_24915 [Streptomyces sp. NPDC047023]|uniref:hypothetical protein n=1 Tax=Streptomyces sp. NPDC047023 TaxID=3155139 RepID=UPI0033EEF70D